VEENGGVSVAKAEVFRGNSVDVVEGVWIASDWFTDVSEVNRSVPKEFEFIVMNNIV